jgi:hypothetical protein
MQYTNSFSFEWKKRLSVYQSCKQGKKDCIHESYSGIILINYFFCSASFYGLFLVTSDSTIKGWNPIHVRKF